MDTRSEILETCGINLQRMPFLNSTANGIGTAYLQTSSLGKHSYFFAPARNFSTLSPKTDGQNWVNPKLENSFDEKANAGNKNGHQEKVDGWKFQNTSSDGLIPLRPKTFEELRNSEGYVDKTKLILDFHYKFEESTCILRQRRSGKTRAIQMLKSFYWVPRINVDTYDPEAPMHSPSKKCLKERFSMIHLNGMSLTRKTLILLRTIWGNGQ
jgi:hypothetical protein